MSKQTEERRAKKRAQAQLQREQQASQDELYESTINAELSEDSKKFRLELMRMFSQLLPLATESTVTAEHLKQKVERFGRIVASNTVYWAISSNPKRLHFFGCPAGPDGRTSPKMEDWGEYMLVPTETGDLGVIQVGTADGTPIPGAEKADLIPLVTTMQVLASSDAIQRH